MAIGREMIEVLGVVLYCDYENCGKRGPSEVGEDTDAVLNRAIIDGWETGDKGDFCPQCVAKRRVVP